MQRTSDFEHSVSAREWEGSEVNDDQSGSKMALITCGFRYESGLFFNCFIDVDEEAHLLSGKCFFCLPLYFALFR